MLIYKEKYRLSEQIQIWQGVFSSFSEAANSSIGPGFSGVVWKDRQAAVMQEIVTALKAKKPIPLFHKQRITCLPPVVAMLLSSCRKVRILDFGGGLGVGYAVLLETIPFASERIEYCVVELPPVCDEAKWFSSEESIQFVHDLPTNEDFHLIYSSSAIQYVEDWRGILESLAAYGAKYLLLSDVFAGDIPGFVTLQNYYGSRIPHWFINLDELVSVAAENGYELMMKTVSTSRRLGADDILPMNNFPPEYRLDYSLHLLLRACIG